jgi:hypothetical protein
MPENNSKIKDLTDNLSAKTAMAINTINTTATMGYLPEEKSDSKSMEIGK